MPLRTFSNRDVDFMKFTWKTYIQPILDYASQLWSPVEGELLYKMESLLKSFTEKIKNMGNYDYGT